EEEGQYGQETRRHRSTHVDALSPIAAYPISGSTEREGPKRCGELLTADRFDDGIHRTIGQCRRHALHVLYDELIVLGQRLNRRLRRHLHDFVAASLKLLQK